MVQIDFSNVAIIAHYCKNEATSEEDKRDYIMQRLKCTEKEASEILLGFALLDNIGKSHFGHSDFFDSFGAIRKHIISEISDAVKANDGFVQFGDDGPIVAINQDTGPIDVKITNVYFENGYLCLTGWAKDEWDEWDDENVFYVEWDDIFIENLGYILDRMYNLKLIK